MFAFDKRKLRPLAFDPFSFALFDGVLRFGLLSCFCVLLRGRVFVPFVVVLLDIPTIWFGTTFGGHSALSCVMQGCLRFCAAFGSKAPCFNRSMVIAALYALGNAFANRDQADNARPSEQQRYEHAKKSDESSHNQAPTRRKGQSCSVIWRSIHRPNRPNNPRNRRFGACAV